MENQSYTVMTHFLKDRESTRNTGSLSASTLWSVKYPQFNWTWESSSSQDSRSYHLGTSWLGLRATKKQLGSKMTGSFCSMSRDSVYSIQLEGRILEWIQEESQERSYSVEPGRNLLFSLDLKVFLRQHNWLYMQRNEHKNGNHEEWKAWTFTQSDSQQIK